LAEKEMRNFALRDEKGNEISVFTGKSSRQAALKAANRGHTDIKLREAGHEEGARIHRREGAGGQAQGRAGLDEGQDLEAQGQDGRNGEAGVALKPRSLQVPAWPMPQQYRH
jgi:hypothetical protein